MKSLATKIPSRRRCCDRLTMISKALLLIAVAWLSWMETVAVQAFTITTRTLDFLQEGAIPNNSSRAAARHNTELLSSLFLLQSSQPDRNETASLLIRIPQTAFYLLPEVQIHRLANIVIQLDGSLRFLSKTDDWVNSSSSSFSNVTSCILIDHCQNITLTSSSSQRGRLLMLVDQYDSEWTPNNRSLINLLHIRSSSNIVLERWMMQRQETLKTNSMANTATGASSSTSFSFLYFNGVNQAEVDQLSILSALVTTNTSSTIQFPTRESCDSIPTSSHGIGITVAASTNVNVHDVDLWNPCGDSIRITGIDTTEVDQPSLMAAPFTTANLTLERVNSTSVRGLVIDSVPRGLRHKTAGSVVVRNITFRDIYLHRTVRGIQLNLHRPQKSRYPFYRWNPSSSSFELFDQNNTNETDFVDGRIKNIFFENIVMENVSQWPIWMGPNQEQSEAAESCTLLDVASDVCSSCWPMNSSAHCHAIPYGSIRNVTLKNVRISNPHTSAGVLLGETKNDTRSTNESDGNSQLENIVFDNVRVTKGRPFFYAIKLDETFPGLRLHRGTNLSQSFNENDGTVFLSFGMPMSSSRSLFPFQDGIDDDIDDSTLEDGTSSSRFLLVLFFIILPIMFFAALGWWAWYSNLLQQSRPRRQRRVRFNLPDECDCGDFGGSSLGSKVPLLFSGHNFGQERVATSCQPSLNQLVTITAVLLALVGIVSLFVVLTARGRRRVGLADWQKIDQFYVCQGVTGGVAKGGTWPVPFCFINERWWWRSSTTTHGWSWYLQTVAVVVVCAILPWPLYLLFTILKRRCKREENDRFDGCYDVDQNDSWLSSRKITLALAVCVDYIHDLTRNAWNFTRERTSSWTESSVTSPA